MQQRIPLSHCFEFHDGSVEFHKIFFEKKKVNGTLFTTRCTTWRRSTFLEHFQQWFVMRYKLKINYIFQERLLEIIVGESTVYRKNQWIKYINFVNVF